MLIDWSYFAPALILLLTPIGIFHGRNIRYRAISRDWAGLWGSVLSFPLHVIDLLRAGGGTWLLAHSVTRLPEADGFMKYAPASMQAAVILVGVLLQIIVCKEQDAFNAPFAYVIGLVAGFLPPVVAGFALVLAIAVAAGAHSPAGFFAALSVTVAAAALLFAGKKLLFVFPPICAAALAPWLLAIMFSRELVITHRLRREVESANHGSKLR